MASPLDATILQRLSAAKEEFDQQHKVLDHRLADTRFRLIPESAENLREKMNDARKAAHRLAELAHVIFQPNFSTDDRDHVEHVIGEVSDPNEDLENAILRVNIPEIRDARNPEGFEIWYAEWQVAVDRFRHAGFGVLIQGRALVLVLTRRIN